MVRSQLIDADYGYLRLNQIIGDKKADPPIPPLIPISKSTWWVRVAAGQYPAPFKLSPKISVWRVIDIKNLLQKIGTDDGE